MTWLRDLGSIREWKVELVLAAGEVQVEQTHSSAYVFFLQSQIGVEADLTCVGSCTVDPSMFCLFLWNVLLCCPMGRAEFCYWPQRGGFTAGEKQDDIKGSFNKQGEITLTSSEPWRCRIWRRCEFPLGENKGMECFKNTERSSLSFYCGIETEA